MHYMYLIYYRSVQTWISLNDIDDPGGNFIRGDGSPVTWTNWNPSQPSRHGNYVFLFEI